MGCVVFGNLGVADWPERLQALLAMTIEAGEPWEEAMSRNDLGHLRMEQGDAAEAEAELARAEWVAKSLAPNNLLRARRDPLHARRGAPERRAPGRSRSSTPTARSRC